MPDHAAPFHVPVLLGPILEAASGARRAVDATLGDGGHSAALLGQGVEVLGIDRDPAALAVSRARLGEQGIRYLQASYASREAVTAVAGFGPDFVLLDLGVPPGNWTRRLADLPSVLARRWTCGWAPAEPARRIS